MAVGRTGVVVSLGSGFGTHADVAPTMIGGSGGGRTHRCTVRIATVRTIILSALTLTKYRIISLPVAVSTAINFVLGNNIGIVTFGIVRGVVA